MDEKQTHDKPWQAEADKDILVIFGERSYRGTFFQFESMFRDTLNNTLGPIQTVWIQAWAEFHPVKLLSKITWKFRNGTTAELDTWRPFFCRNVPELVLIRRDLLQKGQSGIEDIRVLLSQHFFDTAKQPGIRVLKPPRLIGRVIRWMHVIQSFPIHCGENFESALFLTLNAAYEANRGGPIDVTGERIWSSCPGAIEVTPQMDWLHVDRTCVAQQLTDSEWSKDPYFELTCQGISSLVSCTSWVRLYKDRVVQVQTQLVSILQSSLLPDLIQMVSEYLSPISLPVTKPQR